MLRVLSLFSGIGAFEKALDRLDIDYELVNYCEIDKYAAKAYSLIHDIPQEKNLVDVTKVDTSKLENIDLVTYGFPCQDISISGHQKGFFDENGNTTRSGLFFEALRIIQDTKPKYAIAENVKNLMSKSFERELDIVLNSLGAAGYNNYCKVLNAKDYGIPQNRERVFIVSIRRDVDDFSFDFPKKETLELRMKDLLEKEVDEKYYMSDKILNSILSPGTKNFHPKPEIDLEVARTLTATMHKMHRAGVDNYVSDVFINHDIKLDIEDGKAVIGKDIEPIRLGNIYGEDKGTGYAGNVWDKDAIAPTLMTMQGGNRQPMIIDDIYASRPPRVYEEYAPTLRACKCGELKVAEPVIDKVDDKLEITYPNEPFVVASRGRYGEDGKVEQHLEPNLDGFSNTLTTVQKDNYVAKPQENTLRIRKLTPKECFRLMGFDDKDIDILVANGISNTQLYKMAGNSIVVNVMEKLMECLLLKKKEEPDLFSAFEIY